MRSAVAILVVMWTAAAAAADAAAGQRTVSGRVTLVDKDDRVARDVGQAVVWLEASGPVGAAPESAQILMADKEFLPQVVVVPTGSRVAFPNNDPFNHNVFSLSQEGPFDLGLYGRDEARSVAFPSAGIIRVYCNVHPRMSAFIVVRDNPFYARPGADGTFSISGVPPGRYVLRAWHERAREFSRDIEIGSAGVTGVEVTLDARGYRREAHLDKYGRPYPQRSRRY